MMECFNWVKMLTSFMNWWQNFSCNFCTKEFRKEENKQESECTYQTWFMILWKIGYEDVQFNHIQVILCYFRVSIIIVKLIFSFLNNQKIISLPFQRMAWKDDIVPDRSIIDLSQKILVMAPLMIFHKFTPLYMGCDFGHVHKAM